MILRYTTVIAILWAQCAFGQATFLFWNYHPTGLDAPVLDANGNRLFGDNYVAVLYGGATQDSLTPARLGAEAMQPVPFTYMYNGRPGYFSQAGFVHINMAPDGYAWLQVRAWDMRLGATYDDVVRLGLGGYGVSTLFQARGGDIEGTGRPPQPLLGLESFSLVPEPGPWALLAVGAGIVFWSYRRRFV